MWGYVRPSRLLLHDFGAASRKPQATDPYALHSVRYTLGNCIYRGNRFGEEFTFCGSYRIISLLDTGTETAGVYQTHRFRVFAVGFVTLLFFRASKFSTEVP